MTNISFEHEIWNNFSQIDVSNKIDKKMNMSYLSWSNAWHILMQYYPESTFKFLEMAVYPDNTVEVICEVTVKKGERESTRQMWLPVMDHKNNAIENPNSRKLSDSKMRCLVKCIALFGLGLYIYSGEDLPEKEENKELVSNENLEKINNYIRDFNCMGSVEAFIKKRDKRFVSVNTIKNIHAIELIDAIRKKFDLNQ